MKSLLRYPAAWSWKFNRSRKAMPVAGLISKSGKSVFNRLFPVGYEDETGFHCGEQSGLTREKPPEHPNSAGTQP